jgi:hypothetical protein
VNACIQVGNRGRLAEEWALIINPKLQVNRPKPPKKKEMAKKLDSGTAKKDDNLKSQASKDPKATKDKAGSQKNPKDAEQKKKLLDGLFGTGTKNPKQKGK